MSVLPTLHWDPPHNAWPCQHTTATMGGRGSYDIAVTGRDTHRSYSQSKVSAHIALLAYIKVTRHMQGPPTVNGRCIGPPVITSRRVGPLYGCCCVMLFSSKTSRSISRR